MATKLDIRQSISHDPLNQLVGATGVQGNVIFQAINSELIVPLRLSATGLSRVVTVGNATVTNPNTGKVRTTALIDGKKPTFTGGTVTFPQINGGNITFSTAGSISVALSCPNGNEVYTLLCLSGLGILSAIVGTPATTGTATIPSIGLLSDIFVIGCVRSSRADEGGDFLNVYQSDVIQFVGGTDNPHGTTGHEELTANYGGTGSHVAFITHTAGSTGVHGLTGSSAVVGTSTIQSLTNKDIDGGTASATSRITLPSGATGVLWGLTGYAGSMYYATDTQQLLLDNGTALVSFTAAPQTGFLTGLTGSLALSPNQTLTIEDVDGGVVTAGFWVAGANMNVGRYSLAGCGTQMAALSFGGNSGSIAITTELYNGSAWTLGNPLVLARQHFAGCGTQLAALAFGGQTAGSLYSSTTELYNGGTWTAGGSGLTARYRLAGCGTQNAALSFGGLVDPGIIVSTTEKFDGSAWSASAGLSTARQFLAGCGTQNAALSFGGNTAGGGYSSTTEKFDGTSWSTSGNILTARYELAGCGTQNAALNFGGDGGASTVESYNGYIWSVAAPLVTGRLWLAGCGTQMTALNFGGDGTGIVTERYLGSAKVSAYVQATDGVGVRTNVDQLPMTVFTGSSNTAVVITLLLQDDVSKQQFLDQGYGLPSNWSLIGGTGATGWVPFTGRFFYRAV